ncbi:hypothetical protein J4419_04400 [Candidatus Woesearchaeota archaeon]|nr:hypothetical protein [Candidatus Woesearchaeota archaeon]
MGDFTWNLTTLVREFDVPTESLNYKTKERLFTIFIGKCHKTFRTAQKVAHDPHDLRRLFSYCFRFHELALRKENLEEEAEGKGYIVGALLGMMDAVRETGRPLLKEVDGFYKQAAPVLKSGQLGLPLTFLSGLLVDAATRAPNPPAREQINTWAQSLAA